MRMEIEGSHFLNLLKEKQQFKQRISELEITLRKADDQHKKMEDTNAQIQRILTQNSINGI